MSTEDAKRILLVEDEENLRELVRGRLESSDYEVAVADDGYKALALVREFQPHLIILDLMLPKMDGYSVCRMLRAGGTAEHIPIILFSARSSDDDRRRGIDCGASAYVSKPFDPPVLLAKIRELLDPEAWTAKQAEQTTQEAPATAQPTPQTEPATAPEFKSTQKPKATPKPAHALATGEFEEETEPPAPQPTTTDPPSTNGQTASAGSPAPSPVPEPEAEGKPRGFFARLFSRLFRSAGSK